MLRHNVLTNYVEKYFFSVGTIIGNVTITGIWKQEKFPGFRRTIPMPKLRILKFEKVEISLR